MIDVLGFALTFLLAWNGRDRVWTPTFEGPPAQRFEQAMKHYKLKMGLDEELVFDLHPDTRHPADQRRCSSVEAAWVSGEGPAGFEDYTVVPRRGAIVTWWGKGKGCSKLKPEFWALHEACHLRYMHHLTLTLGAERRESEAKGCMVAYSQKERR